jgi:hypothetical protein
MDNFHTCTVGRVDLIMAIVAVMHGQLLKFSSDVVGGAGIKVPFGISAR